MARHFRRVRSSVGFEEMKKNTLPPWGYLACAGAAVLATVAMATWCEFSFTDTFDNFIIATPCYMALLGILGLRRGSFLLFLILIAALYLINGLWITISFVKASTADMPDYSLTPPLWRFGIPILMGSILVVLPAAFAAWAMLTWRRHEKIESDTTGEIQQRSEPYL